MPSGITSRGGKNDQNLPDCCLREAPPRVPPTPGGCSASLDPGGLALDSVKRLQVTLPQLTNARCVHRRGPRVTFPESLTAVSGRRVTLVRKFRGEPWEEAFTLRAGLSSLQKKDPPALLGRGWWTACVLNKTKPTGEKKRLFLSVF